MSEIAAYVVDTSDHRTVCTWLKTNGIDPNEIPFSTVILLEPDPESGFGEWLIRYEVYLRDAHGRRYLEAGTEELASKEIASRLEIDPPMEWLTPLTLAPGRGAQV